MKAVILHGSPRKGNTYKATEIFKDELVKSGNVDFVEFFLPQALPEFCLGCQLCLGGPSEKCPHFSYVSPIVEALLEADAIVVASPHYGASTIPGGLKNLFDHLDFLTLVVAPREEMFGKKAFVITTGSGSKSAIRLISKFLKGWGVNRVYALGIRMFIDRWDKMSEAKKHKSDALLRKKARAFFHEKEHRAYFSTVLFYHMAKFVLQRYVREEGYPFAYWNARGWFSKRPF
jgi:multimeric flavodoxin WrbA